MKTKQIKLDYKNEIIKGSYEHRIYIFLNDLYVDQHFASLRNYFKKHKIGAFRTDVLIELGFIEKITYANYYWISGKPTIPECIYATNYIRKLQKEWVKKHKENKEKIKKINEFDVWREKIVEDSNNYNSDIRDNNDNDLKKIMDKKDLKDEVTITPELKSKHISLFWGMFKFEIKIK